MARPNFAYRTTLSSFIPFSHTSTVADSSASWAVMSAWSLSSRFRACGWDRWRKDSPILYLGDEMGKTNGYLLRGHTPYDLIVVRKL